MRSFTLLIAALVFSQNGFADQKLLGRWQYQPVQIDATQSHFSFSLEFSGSTIKQTAQCQFGKGQLLSVSVQSPVKIIGDKISVLEPQQAIKKQQSDVCRAALERGDMTFQILDDELILHEAVGGPIKLTRPKP